MSIYEKSYVVTMPDGSEWAVPVRLIADNRANNYKAEFNDSLSESLKEDTLPLFEEVPYEIEDWARNNMDWDDVKSEAELITPPSKCDFEEGWINGKYRIQ